MTITGSGEGCRQLEEQAHHDGLETVLEKRSFGRKKEVLDIELSGKTPVADDPHASRSLAR